MKSSAIMGLLVVACASSGGSGGVATDVGTVGGGDQNANVRHVSMGVMDAQADARSTVPAEWHDVPASVPFTWQYLPLAYKKLGLSITRYDSTQHIIEGERLRSRSNFGSKQLTSILECGDVMGIPNVTRFDVNIEVRTVVRPSGTQSSVASAVIASAAPSSVSGVRTPCVVDPTAANEVAAAVLDVASAANK